MTFCYTRRSVPCSINILGLNKLPSKMECINLKEIVIQLVVLKYRA